mmetsp:Transcript_68074/g.181161  ORF Transcript_68074/g.181161 Transcript_68074/m.181161 type:complete len:257 (-) Transcript_68074:120-890(-)
MRARWLAPLRRGLVTATSPKPIKRFYEAATVQQTGSTWQVFLDGKVVKTPRGSLLELPAQGVAQRVANEWQGQGVHLKPKEMPFTTLGCTTVDMVRPDIQACVERLLPYLACDTLCFEDENDLLAERQQKEWGPMRRWFEEHFGVELAVSRSLGVPGHPEGVLPAVAEALAGRDEWELCAMEVVTSTAKSLIVGVALMEKLDINAEDALRLALLEEHFQIERWGLVEGEHDVSHETSRRWLEAASRFAKHRRGSPS